MVRCVCKRGEALQQIDKQYRPEPKKRSLPFSGQFSETPRQYGFEHVPDWGKNAAGDDT